jgi:hypothetical protein
MKKLIYSLSLLFVVSTACDDDDINVFEKTADERAAEAIASLKEDLVAPARGWKVKYKPVDEAGSYYVLMDFDEDNTVTIKTDLGANGGEFFEQTITYRIDNSLGLELVLETYSFFSYLFELNQATFGAEYEFIYVNKTPDDELVFTSKSDLADKTILLFEEATAADENLLGPEVATGLGELSQDLNRFTPSLKLTYEDKDVVIYLVLNDVNRIIFFSTIARKSDLNISQSLNLLTSYYIEGNSLVLETPLSTTFAGSSISIESIECNTPGETQLSICTDPFTVHTYSGVTSAGDDVLLETTMYDLSGGTFSSVSDIYLAPLGNILKNRAIIADSIAKEIPGAQVMYLLYDAELNDGSVVTGIGFGVENKDNTFTIVIREFTPVHDQNNIVFNFKPGFRFLGNEQTDADLDKINTFLDALAQDGKTFVFKPNEIAYEFHNPCTGLSVGFLNLNN